MSKWEDFGILTKVLATSQQEYLDNLKRQRDEHKEEGDMKYLYDTEKPSTSQWVLKTMIILIRYTLLSTSIIFFLPFLFFLLF